jgi:hypothetical protein
MDDVVYLSPVPGRYFRTDGLMTSDIPAGTKPLMPTAAELADFVDGYTGDQILSGEANWGDLGLAAADLAGIGSEVRTAVGLATEVATMASGYGAIVVMGLKLLSWMTKEGASQGGGADPILGVLQRIDARLRRIETEQVAEFKLDRRTTLDLLQGRSRTAMWKAQDYMARGRPQDAFSLNTMAIADFESQAAAETLVQDIDSSFWLRPANSLYLATDPSSPSYSNWMAWMPEDRAPAVDGLTWDYRWALPSVLHVITARVAVLTALSDSSFRSGTAGGNEILRYVGFIERVRKRITSGLRALTYVRPEMLALYPSTGRVPVAAGDIYTGRGLATMLFTPHWTKEWFQPHLPWPVPSYQIVASPRNAEELVTNVKVVGSFWWSVMYATTGIPELERYEGELRKLVKPGWTSEYVAQLTNPLRVTSEGAAAANTAKGLVGLTLSGDDAADARRAARVHAVLRDNYEARELAHRFVDELLQQAPAERTTNVLDGIDDAQVTEDLTELLAPPPWPNPAPEPPVAED